ncbi:MAG: MerR family transcriptional regulator [Propionicimonas sp.]|nr:MerR family transcriptional regulator [Propionicimonas sp.]
MLIGDLAARSGISARMLRHYDRLGLVSPTARTAGGYREYAPEDVSRLFQVEALRSLGLSLQQVAEVLADLCFDPTAMVDEVAARTRERLARDQELLDRLDQIRGSDPAAWTDVLRIIDLVRGLGAEDPSARQRFVLSLAAEAGQDVNTLVEAALDEADPQVAGALYWALDRLGDAAVPWLVAALDSAEPQRRRRAATALTKLSSPRAAVCLAAAFGHPDPLVGGRAALLRGRLGEPDAIPRLVQLVVDGQDDVEAADVLGGLARDRHLADLIARAITAELARAPGPARERLAAALAEIPGAPAEAALAGLVEDEDPGVAATARFVLHSRSR